MAKRAKKTVKSPVFSVFSENLDLLVLKGKEGISLSLCTETSGSVTVKVDVADLKAMAKTLEDAAKRLGKC